MMAGLALAAALLGGDALGCEDVKAVPETVQVAWISKNNRSVGGATSVEVVRVADLREWARQHDSDATRLLQGMGMIGRNAEADPAAYKVVVFDVAAADLCRPLEDGEVGSVVGGVPVCDTGDQGPVRSHRRGYSGCGYSSDTLAGTRGLDVYRISWEDAVRQGFCLFPVERFLAGA